MGIYDGNWKTVYTHRGTPQASITCKMRHMVGDEICIEGEDFVVSSICYNIEIFKIYVRMKRSE